MSEIISLKKGETISLYKSPVIDLTKGGKGLSFVTVGLGWDSVKKTKTEEKKGGFFSRLFGSETSGSGYSEDIDCDAFVIEKKDGCDVETVFFGNLSNKNQSIKHTGDNLTGEGEGDDESILIDLSACLSDEIVIGTEPFVVAFDEVELHDSEGIALGGAGPSPIRSVEGHGCVLPRDLDVHLKARCLLGEVDDYALRFRIGIIRNHVEILGQKVDVIIDDEILIDGIMGIFR